MDTEKSFKSELINELNSLKEPASLSDIQKLTSKFFSTKMWESKVGRKAFLYAVILATITLFLITTLHSKIFDIVAYGLWTIVPPSWFMYEYTWLFPDEARFDSNQLSDLKYKHELAGKIWGGLVLLITAVLYLKYGQKIF